MRTTIDANDMPRAMDTGCSLSVSGLWSEVWSLSSPVPRQLTDPTGLTAAR
jgi:hypothetical protein